MKRLPKTNVYLKRFIALILAFSLFAAFLTGCTQKPHDTLDIVSADKLRIVCTIFPLYDWVRQILGDRADSVELSFLLDNRIDLHSFQPSFDDIARISTSDLFIYVGGESDRWVETALQQAVNHNMVVLRLISILGDDVKLNEVIEGMESENHDEVFELDSGNHNMYSDNDKREIEFDEHAKALDKQENYPDEHANGLDKQENYSDEHANELDEHVWLSLECAKAFCAVITNALSTLDADNAETYKENLIAYTQELATLDEEYQATVNASTTRTLLFADRFPFRYLTDDYGIDCFAAFPGCSAESEASIETIVFLLAKADELDLHNVIVTESSDQSIAITIINNTRDKNQQVLVLNSMQSATLSDAQNGVSYLSIMESNLQTLKEALK